MDEDVARLPCDPQLLAQVREAFGRVVYSHKTHEKQADIDLGKYWMQQWALIFLTAASSTTFLASLLDIFVDQQWANLSIAFIALLVTVMSIGALTFRFSDSSESHRDVASKLWNVRESYLSLITDLMAGVISDQDARGRRDVLQEEAHSVYVSAPRTGRCAYRRAHKALKLREEMTFTSQEIDQFMPEALRMNVNESS